MPDFDLRYLTDPDTTPAALASVASQLREFADGASGSGEAAALAKVSDDALLALVKLLTTRQDGARLALLQAAPLAKAPRKEVGRALHTLKAKGIDCEIPEGRVGGIRYTVEQLPCYLGLPLPNGMRFILMSDIIRGQVDACVFIGTDSGEIAQIAQVDATRSRFKKVLEQLQSSAHADGFPMVFAEASLEHVRWLIHGALAAAHSKGLPVPLEANRFEMLFGPPPKSEPVHAALALLGEPDPSLLERGVGLLGHAHHGGGYHMGVVDCMFEETMDVKAYQARLGDAAGEDDEGRPERVKVALNDVVDELWDAERRERSARRILDAAYVLARSDGMNVARIAHTTAVALQDTSITASSIPWAHQATFNWLAPDANVVEHH
ncbi:MAG: hypothetical protein IV100_04250 [Myxococcales bacterium]|nr:hypothetical protein [Myxococcales bacterium]